MSIISPKIEAEFGLDISLDELKKEILKDEPFYKTGGGVTFSGGEPLLQIKKLEILLKSLKDNNINICFETALFVHDELVKIAIPYTNEFIADIKMLNHKDCADILGGNVNQYLSNLKLLDLKKTTFRIPVNKFSLNDESLILDLLKDFKPKKVEIFKLHNLAKRKYDILGRDFYSEEVSDEVLNEFREIM